MGSQCKQALVSGIMADQPEIWKATPMADLFDKIQKLPDKTVGVPNFRRVPGYKVYCCGQPTVEGFTNVLNKVCGETYPKDGKIVWINMRQEPIVYVNGNPICARPPNKIGEYAELGNVTRDGIKVDEAEFVKVIEGKVKENNGKLKFVDVNKKENEVEAKEIVSLHDVIEKVKEKFPGLSHNRIPVCNSAAPLESDFDTLCGALEGTLITTPVIVSDQVGLSRATTGCVAACLFREFQIAAGFEGLVETVPGVNPTLLKMDRYVMDAAKDPLFRGEFEVIKELVAELKDDGAAAKNQCDKIIDKNGPTKCGGTGIKQLRENIAESKLSYEIMDDAAQTFLKAKIMDNIHKYFYMICFTAYLRDQSKVAKDGITDEDKKAFCLTGGKVSTPTESLKLKDTFVSWMDTNASLRTICDDGKGKLQWEREIPQDALDNLNNLATTDFKANLGKIIHDIYLTGHNMFKDMPQGDHKKRAKYRFASKTLMRILPNELKAEVEGLIAGKTMTLDLYEILGQCTWGQGKSL